MRHLLISLILWLTLGLAYSQTIDFSWSSATIYQVYPRSFQDSDGDGVGDLPGLIARLPHIKNMGFDAVWVSPFFASPQEDFGYDISDYRAIAPEYGTMAICDRLIAQAHKLGLRVIFDLVMNHTSHQHKWFQASLASRNGPYANWYVWRDGTGKNGKRPPNNWKAMIGGSGWHYHPQRGQWYWASFLPFQPDLNYNNPAVRAEMLDVARFWLRKGVDGFRLDIFNAIAEDSLFRNNPFTLKLIPSEDNPDGFFQKAQFNINQEGSFEFATQLRALLDSFQSPPRHTVGEVFGNADKLKGFMEHNGKPGLHSVFMFRTLGTPFKAKAWATLIHDFEHDFPQPFAPTYVIGNHDRRRSISTVDNNLDKAKLLALIQFTLRGSAYTYYGDEVGIPKSTIKMKDGLDPLAQRYRWIPQFMINWTGESLNRDECRTPMLWDATRNAGFCDSTATPWLPLAGNVNERSVAQQITDPASLLNWYKQVLALRKRNETLINGSCRVDFERSSKNILAFYREMNNQLLLVAINFSKKPVPFMADGQVLLSTHNSPQAEVLLPFEGRVVKLK